MLCFIFLQCPIIGGVNIFLQDDTGVLESNEIQRFELLRNELIELERRVERSAKQSENEEVFFLSKPPLAIMLHLLFRKVPGLFRRILFI